MTKLEKTESVKALREIDTTLSHQLASILEDPKRGKSESVLKLFKRWLKNEHNYEQSAEKRAELLFAYDETGKAISGSDVEFFLSIELQHKEKAAITGQYIADAMKEEHIEYLEKENKKLSKQLRKDTDKRDEFEEECEALYEEMLNEVENKHEQVVEDMQLVISRISEENVQNSLDRIGLFRKIGFLEYDLLLSEGRVGHLTSALCFTAALLVATTVGCAILVGYYV